MITNRNFDTFIKEMGLKDLEINFDNAKYEIAKKEVDTFLNKESFEYYDIINYFKIKYGSFVYCENNWFLYDSCDYYMNLDCKNNEYVNDFTYFNAEGETNIYLVIDLKNNEKVIKEYPETYNKLIQDHYSIDNQTNDFLQKNGLMRLNNIILGLGLYKNKIITSLVSMTDMSLYLDSIEYEIECFYERIKNQKIIEE